MHSDQNMLAAEEIAQHWVQRSRRNGWARVMRTSQPPELNADVTLQTNRIVADYLKSVSNELCRPIRSALEVGCGIGRLTPTIAGLAQRVTALDLTPEMLDYAQRNCAHLSNVEFCRSWAEERPWGAERFDVGICVWVLMHVLDDIRLDRICRALASSVHFLVLIEYEHAHLPVSRWSRLRTLEEYFAMFPGAELVERRVLDYGGDRSPAALVRFPYANQPAEAR